MLQAGALPFDFCDLPFDLFFAKSSAQSSFQKVRFANLSSAIELARFVPQGF
jgi:hypothetical protein